MCAWSPAALADDVTFAVPSIDVTRTGDMLSISGMASGTAGTEVTGRLTVSRVSGSNRVQSRQSGSVIMAGSDKPVPVAQVSLNASTGTLEAEFELLDDATAIARSQLSLDLGAR